MRYLKNLVFFKQLVAIACNRAGVSIVETVVAILILSVIGGAVTMLTVQVTEANNCARLRNEASKYAEEGIEEVRDYKANYGFTMMQSKVGCFADGDLSVSPASCTGYAPQPISGATGFSRTVRVQQSGSGLGVDSAVTLSAKCSPRSVDVQTFFYDY